MGGDNNVSLKEVVWESLKGEILRPETLFHQADNLKMEFY